jgi:5-methylcytosine-specific restriction enzyme B
MIGGAVMVLDERLRQELKDLYTKLINEGKLLSKAQLEGYYETFRKRFGPDQLKTLDGEALLEFMHAHGNHDSLVYWLEFKDDEEFPARFGSIAGGSALKFGIYRRQETGMWMTGHPLDQREISIDEAIQHARRHRDQLIRGAQLLEQLPANGTDGDYRVLQEQMDALAPDVSNLAWGHKYFSLLYPDKLDDYHNPDYQRYYLIKLLQIPPEGKGRYLVAGRYVAIAHELGIPLTSLTTITNFRHGRPSRYWRIGTSEGGQPRNRWGLMRDGSCVAIGWPELGDLSVYPSNQALQEAIGGMMARTHYPDSPQVAGRKTHEVFRFVKGVADGDIVLASDGAAVLGVGKIIGDYTYEPSSDFPHRRPVEWLSLVEWRLPRPEGLRTTVFELKRDVRNLVAIERHLFEASSTPSLPKPSPLSSRLSGLPGRIQSILERKGQVILYGPPGTGKTHWAEFTARELAARSSVGVAFDQLSSDQKAFIHGDGHGAGGLVRMCCFHPGYGYEEFLEGYRPVVVDGRMVFMLRDGIFKKLCQDAAAKPEHKFYLIIDEINRGDIPRIFGELLTVLEKNKRGKSMLLPLSGKPFQVPANVYLIGTMNTADRSIALLDTALRRRFGFIELMPDSSLLGDVVVGGIPLGPWLEALNRRLCDHIGRDARNLQIGHAYMLEGERPIADLAKLSKVIQEEIIPLLEEYCYEDYAALEKILGQGLVDIHAQHMRYELFEDSRQDELVQALLSPCPDIATTRPAVASETVTSAEGDDDQLDDTEDEGQ